MEKGLATKIDAKVEKPGEKSFLAQVSDPTFRRSLGELISLFIPFNGDKRIHNIFQDSLISCPNRKAKAAVYLSEDLIYVAKYCSLIIGGYIILDCILRHAH